MPRLTFIMNIVVLSRNPLYSTNHLWMLAKNTATVRCWTTHVCDLTSLEKRQHRIFYNFQKFGKHSRWFHGWHNGYLIWISCNPPIWNEEIFTPFTTEKAEEINLPVCKSSELALGVARTGIKKYALHHQIQIGTFSLHSKIVPPGTQGPGVIHVWKQKPTQKPSLKPFRRDWRRKVL